MLTDVFPLVFWALFLFSLKLLTFDWHSLNSCYSFLFWPSSILYSLVFLNLIIS